MRFLEFTIRLDNYRYEINDVCALLRRFGFGLLLLVSVNFEVQNLNLKKTTFRNLKINHFQKFKK